MKNNFAEEYKTYKKNEANYYKAQAEKNAVGAESARVLIRLLEDRILEKGEDYFRIYELYKEAKNNGNEYIDLHDCIRDRDVALLVNLLRTFGIQRFTLSSTWSSAVETAWAFQQNGCHLEGLVEINSFVRNWDGSRSKAPAYLFSVE